MRKNERSSLGWIWFKHKTLSVYSALLQRASCDLVKVDLGLGIEFDFQKCEPDQDSSPQDLQLKWKWIFWSIQ